VIDAVFGQRSLRRSSLGSSLGLSLGFSLRMACILCALATATAGCTTSRAVRAWHQGIAAEDAGRVRVARRKYKESYGRNTKHVGAELARLRLLARVSESRKKAEESLKELLEKKSDRPEVLVFAAWWALLDGDVATAKDRADAVQISKGERLAVALKIELRRLAKAIATEVERKKRTVDAAAMTAAKNNKLAVEALADGEPRRARDLLASVAAADEDAHWTIRFNLALAYLQLGEHARARRQLKRAARVCGADCAPVKANLKALTD
jgi:tetratricopeptide (TPR) repeat protein